VAEELPIVESVPGRHVLPQIGDHGAATGRLPRGLVRVGADQLGVGVVAVHAFVQHLRVGVFEFLQFQGADNGGGGAGVEGEEEGGVVGAVEEEGGLEEVVLDAGG
jgi:hypothetical protein